jgi:hypothetical protein
VPTPVTARVFEVDRILAVFAVKGSHRVVMSFKLTPETIPGILLRHQHHGIKITKNT